MGAFDSRPWSVFQSQNRKEVVYYGIHYLRGWCVSLNNGYGRTLYFRNVRIYLYLSEKRQEITINAIFFGSNHHKIASNRNLRRFLF